MLYCQSATRFLYFGRGGDGIKVARAGFRVKPSGGALRKMWDASDNRSTSDVSLYNFQFKSHSGDTPKIDATTETKSYRLYRKDF